MRTARFVRFVAAPLLLVGLGAISAGCSSASPLDNPLSCSEFSTADFSAIASLSLDANVKAFLDGAARLSALGDGMVTSVGDACANIAMAGGATDTWSSKAGKDRTSEACTQAQAQITAALMGSATLDIEITGGHCEADINAQADCVGKCDASAMCTAAQIAASCEPGHLAGTCSGMCTGACDSTVGIMCGGTCSATCTGMCTGTCAGMMNNANCMGKCDGTCQGTCKGTCEASGAVMCDGQCEGTCSVDFTAPHCEGKFTPPMCNVSADCSASCNASVQASATCTPPTMVITANGTGSANLQAVVTALTTELPKLYIVATEQGKIAVDSFATLATVATNLQGSATGSTKALACLAAAVQATAEASVNVSVSVMASASVSGSAGS